MRHLADDPRHQKLLEVTEVLTHRGGSFEVVVEDVLGEQIEVFRERPRSLRDVLTAGARFGARDAYVFSDGHRIRFDQVAGQVGAVAEALRERHGVGSGDRVAVCAQNSAEWILAFWATACLDAVLVAMNGWWTGPEMRNALDLTRPSVLIMDEKRRARLDTAPEAPLLLVERDFAGITDEPADLPTFPIGEDDPFLLFFTSGTTGRPKAAELSHRSVISYLMVQSFIAARGMAIAGYTPPPDMVPGSRLAPYPLFHVSGLSMNVGTLFSGSTSVWPLGRFDPATVIELTKREQVRQWGGGTTHIVRLLDHPDIETLDPTQMQSVGVGGSATPPEVIRKIEERFPHLNNQTSSGYGSTETGLISWTPGWMLKAAPDCVGSLMPTVTVRITDDDGNEVPDGEVGNIESRSWMNMIGYWDNPEADAETLRPGRFVRTGDFGRYEAGILYVASRRRDMIIRGGENVYPFEVEHRLDEHPDVVEAAAFGVDHPVHGQDVTAVVVVRPGATVTVDELKTFCAESLAYYKIPAEIRLTTEALPRNPAGKVMKHVLSGDAENTFVED